MLSRFWDSRLFVRYELLQFPFLFNTMNNKDTESLAEGRFTQAGAFIKSPAAKQVIGSVWFIIGKGVYVFWFLYAV